MICVQIHGTRPQWENSRPESEPLPAESAPPSLDPCCKSTQHIFIATSPEEQWEREIMAREGLACVKEITWCQRLQHEGNVLTANHLSLSIWQPLPPQERCTGCCYVTDAAAVHHTELHFEKRGEALRWAAEDEVFLLELTLQAWRRDGETSWCLLVTAEKKNPLKTGVKSSSQGCEVWVFETTWCHH